MKVRSCKFLSGTPVCARLFSSTWDQLAKRSRKKGYFKSFEEHSIDYSKNREKVKELKKQLEALKEATAAQPQEKAPKETAAECSRRQHSQPASRHQD